MCATSTQLFKINGIPEEEYEKVGLKYQHSYAVLKVQLTDSHRLVLLGDPGNK